MKLTPEELEFLSAWAREEWEPACYQMPSHRLQLAHKVPGAQLLVLIKAWTESEGKKDVDILGAATNPQPRWPWPTWAGGWTPATGAWSSSGPVSNWIYCARARTSRSCWHGPRRRPRPRTGAARTPAGRERGARAPAFFYAPPARPTTSSQAARAARFRGPVSSAGRAAPARSFFPSRPPRGTRRRTPTPFMPPRPAVRNLL